jgi:adenine-specific DNA-methyltransferase
MRLTDYHAKYFAHELTKRCSSDSAEKLAGALVDAQVELKPTEDCQREGEAAGTAFDQHQRRRRMSARLLILGMTFCSSSGSIPPLTWNA